MKFNQFRLTIKGLHGDRDVSLTVNGVATILVDENGRGKTTVLSILYALLSRQLQNLKKHKFDSLEVAFDGGDTMVLESSWLRAIESDGSWREPRVEDFLIHSGKALTHWRSWSASAQRVADNYLRTLAEASVSPELRQTAKKSKLTTSELLTTLRDTGEASASSVEDDRLKLAKFTEELNKRFPDPVLYFPTYRRVEEELGLLGYSDESLVGDGQLIQFGMGDVSTLFAKVTGHLKTAAAEWHAKISGEFLSALTRGVQPTESDYENLRNETVLRIVLARVGSGINESDRGRVLALAGGDDLRKPGFNTLVYFLSKLVQIYDGQREYDTRIKRFVGVVNRYLVDKSIVYDEMRVTIEMIDRHSAQPVPLRFLSSGEKQMVSIFAKLLLVEEKSFVVIFDEPELSLSIDWQRILLPDIIASERCSLLVAATHSPFVFENELDSSVTTLSVVRRHITSDVDVEGADDGV